MGQAPYRGNTSQCDGVYKSTDAGATWTNVGLQDTQQISRIRIHPKNPDIVYVAAQGHVWGPNADRGVYRTVDGGKTWKKVLFVDDKTGASDLVMDPTNPRILYAAFWQVYRQPWSLENGGPDRPLEVDRRRRHLEEAHHRPARGRRRQGRRDGVGVAALACLGDGAARGEGRPLPQ